MQDANLFLMLLMVALIVGILLGVRLTPRYRYPVSSMRQPDPYYVDHNPYYSPNRSNTGLVATIVFVVCLLLAMAWWNMHNRDHEQMNTPAREQEYKPRS